MHAAACHARTSQRRRSPPPRPLSSAHAPHTLRPARAPRPSARARRSRSASARSRASRRRCRARRPRRARAPRRTRAGRTRSSAASRPGATGTSRRARTASAASRCTAWSARACPPRSPPRWPAWRPRAPPTARPPGATEQTPRPGRGAAADGAAAVGEMLSEGAPGPRRGRTWASVAMLPPRAMPTRLGLILSAQGGPDGGIGSGAPSLGARVLLRRMLWMRAYMLEGRTGTRELVATHFVYGFSGTHILCRARCMLLAVECTHPRPALFGTSGRGLPGGGRVPVYSM